MSFGSVDSFFGRGPNGGSAVNLPGDPPWIYRHHPTGWELKVVDGKAAWLPVLSRHTLVAGSNGNKRGPGGRGVVSAVPKARAEQRGWVYLDPADVGSYTQEVTNRRGQTVHLEKWETPVQIGSKTILRFDHAEYDRWRLSLVTGGHVAPPMDEVLADKIAVQAKRASRRVREVHIPAVAAQVEAESSRLQAMRETPPVPPAIVETPAKGKGKVAHG